jgi:hypothetical protein
MKIIFEKSLPGISLALMMSFLICKIQTAQGGTLHGSFSPIPSGTVINLTAAGPLDWVHWGLNTYTSFDRKAGVAPQISNFSVLSSGNPNGFVFVYQLSDNPNGYSWSDGTPTSNVTNTTTGVWAYGIPQMGTGFEFTVPASTNLRTLKVYVGVYAGQSRFTASLSDFSAANYTDDSLKSTNSTSNGVYTIEFAANSPGQTLKIRWNLFFFYQPNGNVTLQSAALTSANANNPPSVSVVSPVENSTFEAGTNITISANASDPDGAISQVEFFDGNVKLGTSFASPYDFVWTNVPAGLHVLKAVATDTNAEFSASMPVEILVYGNGGSLSGSGASPPSVVNLTIEGTNDWAHWGLSNNLSFNHKSGVPQQISNLSPIGTSLIEQLIDSAIAYSWSDGTPVTSAANSTTGIFITGTRNGYEIQAPADTTHRRLKVYAGLYGVQGNFQAYLSDFSAQPFIDTSVSNVFDNTYVVYTLDYSAASAGQSLIVRYRSLTSFDQEFGNVVLGAATLIGTNTVPFNSPPSVSITNPVSGDSFIAPATITIKVEALDSDGSVTNVEFFNGATKLGQSTTSPFSFVWNDVPSGAYSLTATATDNLSVKGTSSPVYITVGNNTNGDFQLDYELFATNGAFGLRIFPTIPQPYSLEASSTLTNWISIFTNQTGSSESNYTETPLTNKPGRFFRGKLWP